MRGKAVEGAIRLERARETGSGIEGFIAVWCVYVGGQEMRLLMREIDCELYSCKSATQDVSE